MVKYARIVFEVEIEEDATEKKICNAMEDILFTFLHDHWEIDDIEISSIPYKSQDN